MLPPHIVMHHIIAVHGPPALILPHTHLHWPIVQYSEWLDKHSEKEAWANVKVCSLRPLCFPLIALLFALCGTVSGSPLTLPSLSPPFPPPSLLPQLIFLQSTLDSYATKVNERGEKTFHEVYPLLYEYGPKLVSQWREDNKQ